VRWHIAQVASSRAREWAKAGGPAFMKEKKAKLRKVKAGVKAGGGGAGEAAPASEAAPAGAGAAPAAGV
jgi:hypothetical protein